GREAVRSGADDYLVKDALDADRLQRTLSLAIERAQRTQMTERLAVAEGLASLGRLAASVAHDVNNPTTYARANLEIVSRHLEVLRAEHPDARLDDAARLVAEARVGIDHVVSIVADLRALGRISERTPERVDLASVVRTACRLTRNELYHRARVNVEVEEGIGIAAYRTRLLQAISNVLLNAAQSFEAGRASKNTVEVRLRKVGEAVEIAIRDTGRGMPPHLLARAFEPFFTARADGTGLGLALVREIVEEHEGTVRIESEVGIGTTVVMTLPLTNRLVPTALVAAPTPSLTGRRHRVLIVDDDALVRRAMARVLRDHDVVQAGDGEEALTLLEEDADYDVIITDVMMPNVYGPELVATLAQRWPELGPRVVLCTGGTLTPEAEALVGAAPTLIEKPIRAAELIATVERIAARADDP
ncbi:MAG: ATP-binding protein, partial [Sandaracinaceae bacterium]